MIPKLHGPLVVREVSSRGPRIPIQIHSLCFAELRNIGLEPPPTPLSIFRVLLLCDVIKVANKISGRSFLEFNFKMLLFFEERTFVKLSKIDFCFCFLRFGKKMNQISIFHCQEKNAVHRSSVEKNIQKCLNSVRSVVFNLS